MVFTGLDGGPIKKVTVVDSGGNPVTPAVLSNSQTLTGNATTVSTNIFQVTGVVEVLRMWGVVTTALGPNVTAAAYRLFDGTANSDITLATGSVISAFSIGSSFFKRGLAATALTIVSASQERVNESTATNLATFSPVVLTQKTGGVSTFIQFTYATTDAPTSGVIQHFLEYRPLSNNGAIAIV